MAVKTASLVGTQVVISDRIPVIMRDGSRGFQTLSVDGDTLSRIMAEGLLQAIQTGSANKHAEESGNGKVKLARTLDAIIAPVAHAFTLDHDAEKVRGAVVALGHKPAAAFHLASALVAAPVSMIREQVVQFIGSASGRAWLKANA